MSNGPFDALDSLLRRLRNNLDVLIYNLELLRRYLIRKLDQVLQFIDELKKRLIELFKVCFPYLLIAVPPAFGIFISVMLQSVVLAGTTLLLIGLLIYAFMRRGSLNETFETGEIITVGPGTRIFGAVIAVIVLFLMYWISVGLFIGAILFLAEFGVVYFLKYEYKHETIQRTP